MSTAFERFLDHGAGVGTELVRHGDEGNPRLRHAQTRADTLQAVVAVTVGVLTHSALRAAPPGRIDFLDR